MRLSGQVKKIQDFPDHKNVFPTVQIKGGVCFLYWDSDYSGKTEFYNDLLKERRMVDLSEMDIIVRDAVSHSIVKKVISKNIKKLSESVTSWNAFGLNTNYFDKNEKPVAKNQELITCYTAKKIMREIEKSKITRNKDLIDIFKVVCPKAAKVDGVPYSSEQVFILEGGEICTASYNVLRSFKDRSSAEAFLKYLQTNFVRFLVSIKKITQDIIVDTWCLVPDPFFMQDIFELNDKKLFKYFDLTEKEIDHIENKIKEWS
jgi:hypothetical protein